MAFVKTGDEQPIERVFDVDGQIQHCSGCGSVLRAFALKQDSAAPVCEKCQNTEGD